MSGPGLIVFVDGLGYDAAVDRGLFPMLPDKRAIVPGVGYSVNIQAELFAGQSPDVAGFFCHWGYAPAGSRLAPLRPILEAWNAVIPAYSWPDVQAHRFLARIVGIDTLRIPFRELPWLKRVGEYHTSTGDTKLLRGGHLVSWARTGERAPRRDSVVCERTLELLRGDIDRPVIATLVDFDSVGHEPGPGTPEFEAAAVLLGRSVSELVQALEDRFPGSPVVVLSDHGQSIVTGATQLDLESVLGRADPKRYVSFVDSTIVRVWTDNPSILARARDYLEGRSHVLSEVERERFGITNERFGALIAIARDGTVFTPSHFHGRVIPKGMHGYHPDARSQWAVWASRGVNLDDATQMTPRLAHDAMMRAFIT